MSTAKKKKILTREQQIAQSKIQEIKNVAKGIKTNGNKQVTSLRNDTIRLQAEVKNIDAQLKEIADKGSAEWKKLTEQRDRVFTQWNDSVKSVKGIVQQVRNLTQQTNAANIYKLAQQILSLKLEGDMQKELDQLKATGKVAEDLFLQMRAVIRGHKTAEITQAPIIVEAVAKIDKQLTDYIMAESSKLGEKLQAMGQPYIDQSIEIGNKVITKIDSLTPEIDRVFGDIGKINQQLDDWQKLSKEDLAATITKTVDEKLRSYTDLDSLYKKIDDGILAKFNAWTGSNETVPLFDSKKTLGPVLQRIHTSITNGVAKKLQPLIQNHVKVIAKITTRIAKLQDQIKAAQQAFKDAIQKYQDMAKDFIQQQTAELGKKISQELGINLLGGLGSAIGGISLGI